jgi:glycosyltransferase involved in cell wall biosynthesis
LLNRTSLIAVLHRPGAEAELSFRTRALDGLWAGVPLLLSEGGEVARLTVDHGWGGVVPAADPQSTAAALEVMLSEREQLRCRRNLAECRAQWQWSTLAAPLLDALSELPTTPRRGLIPATAAAIWMALSGGPRMDRP